MYYEVSITETACDNKHKEHVASIIQTFVKKFDNFGEIVSYLDERYVNLNWLKRVKDERNGIFVDLKGGGRKQVGFVMRYKNSNVTHSPVEHWWQIDWVQINKIKIEPSMIDFINHCNKNKDKETENVKS